MPTTLLDFLKKNENRELPLNGINLLKKLYKIYRYHASKNLGHH